MITIVNYGVGNIKAFLNVYRQLNIPAIEAREEADIKNAKKLILPGVGAFDHAMQKLNNSGMREALDKAVLINEIPILGICVGMQMLASTSDEGELPGLNWIDGTVKKFDISKISHRPHLPHMGWNDVHPVKISPLFKNFPEQTKFYFLHSYYFECNRKDNQIAITDYGSQFSSAVNSKNIFGVQFHPEKSHAFGLQLLQNFANI